MERRKFLLGSGVAFSTILAGCASSDDEEGDPDDENGGNGNGNGEGDENSGNGDGSEDEVEEDDSEPDEEEETEGEDGNDVDEPDPISFSGSGAAVHDDIEIEGGLTVVQAEHTGGESNFIVELVPSEGEFNDTFVNQIGEWDGERADLIDAGTYQLDVEADGDWRIEITQPRAESGDSLPQSLEGDTAGVFGPFEFDGNHTATGEHSGEGNFIVEVFPQDGSFSELVFNEIGDYDGETTFSHDDVGWVAVQADGTWSLELE